MSGSSRSSEHNRRSRRGATKHELMFFGIITVFTCVSIALNWVDTMNPTDEAMLIQHPVLQHPKLKKLGKKLKRLGAKVNELRAKNIAEAKGLGKKVHAARKNNVDSNSDKAVVESNVNANAAAIDGKPEIDTEEKLDTADSGEHTIGGLKCAAYGGPPDEIAAKEMVYWSDISSDAEYISPFKKSNDAKGGPTQYMTFEPDGGGWNNIRMAMETVVVMAHAMGRVLVMPPAQGMYLLRKDRGKQTTDFSFADFFHLESLSKEHAGVDIISHEEFLTREAMTGNLRNKTTGLVEFPPGNRTNWDGEDLKSYKEYMRSVIYTPLWSPSKCLAAFPASGDANDVTDLQNMLKESKGKDKIDHSHYIDNPTPVDADSLSRMKEALAHRRDLCIYNKEMQQERVLHFMCYHKMRVRLLTHFYTFCTFEDWKQQLWEHRFVRDHLRYLDELQCAAGRVVTEMRKIAEKDVENNPDGLFDTLHVRRGDFQYKDTRLEADVLFEKSKDVLQEGAVLYIATDEMKKEFFDIFKKHYKVYFLDDFKHLVSRNLMWWIISAYT